MSWYLILQIALTGGVLTLIGFLIYVLLQLHRTLRNFDELLTTVNRELPAVLIKLQLALDGVNYELDRVEDIVTSFQEVSATVHNTTGIVQRAVASPVIRLASFVSGARTAVASLLKRGKEQEKA